MLKFNHEDRHLATVMKAVFVLMAFAAVTATAQVQVADAPVEGYSENFTIGGSIGSYSELYGVSGTASRRPLATQRFNGNFDINLFGLHTGVNLLYSTEDNRLMQSLNQLGLTGSWKSIRFGAGTIYPNYSPMLLSGAQLLGGELELTPGSFLIGATAGRNRRGVDGDSLLGRPGVYRRMIYAGTIGFGAAGQSFIRLSGLYGNDDTTSIGT